MKRLTIMAASGLLLLASCSKSTDLYEGPAPVDPPTPVTPTETTSDDINANVQKVFGVTFDPNQDWSSTITGEVTINANSSIKRVQVMAYVSSTNEDGDVVTSLDVLNETQLNGATSVKLNYDAPKNNDGIYVSFISDKNYFLRKVEGNSVSLDTKANTRALSQTYNLPAVPEGGFKFSDVGTSIESYASQKGWLPGEKLYALKDYSSQKMQVNDYTQEEKEHFRAMVFSYFKNDKTINNLPLVKNSGIYNENGYPITTGEGPIIVSPAYKADGCLKPNGPFGYEVYNSDLYYYYFKQSDLNSATDKVKFLEQLPKYKVIEFKDCYIEKEDDVIEKKGAFALIYWGDGTPNENTTGSYTFPAGYKIGFMIKAKTTAENGVKQGEIYIDGRLNQIHYHYGDTGEKQNTSNLGKKFKNTDAPRGAWLNLNGRQLLCIESGTDTDFNDIIIDIEGSVDNIGFFPETEHKVYTYCFEDTELGDYDLNDVVIKVERVNETTVKYSIVACGGYDELYVRNINTGVIKDNAEIHGLFGKDVQTFINTEAGGESLPAITVTKTVDKSFSLLNAANEPYIYDGKTGKEIHLSKKGEDPHGIMIPSDFKYPLEKVCIKDAYKEFNSWGQNAVTYTGWYLKPVNDKVYK